MNASQCYVMPTLLYVLLPVRFLL